MTISLDVVQDENLSRPFGQPFHCSLEIHRELGSGLSTGKDLQHRVALEVALPPGTEGFTAGEDHVHRQSVEPGAECSFTAKGAQLLPGSHKDVLRDLVGIIVIEHPANQAVNPWRVMPVEPLERGRVATGSQRRVHSVRIGPAGLFVLQGRRSIAGLSHRGGIGSCDGPKGCRGLARWLAFAPLRVTTGGSLVTTTTQLHTIRAPTGSAISCKGWHQEAALRMLMNNLDPAVAERPEELIVYGGGGKAARNWECYERIVTTLRRLKNDETLLVQSGKPVGVFRTHDQAPRVLIANANLVPRWATWDEFRRLDALGLTMYGQMTAGSWIYIGTQGILQGTYETFAECARQHFGGTLEGRLVVTGGLGGMGGAQPLAATMNGGAFLGVDVDEERVRRRVDTRYCDRLETDLNTALRDLEEAKSRGQALSIGLVGNIAEVLPELLRRGVVPDVLTDQTSAHDLRVGYIPAGMTLKAAAQLRETEAAAYEE